MYSNQNCGNLQGRQESLKQELAQSSKTQPIPVSPASVILPGLFVCIRVG